MVDDRHRLLYEDERSHCPINNLGRVAADGHAFIKGLLCLSLEGAQKSLDDTIESLAITCWQHLPLRKVSP